VWVTVVIVIGAIGLLTEGGFMDGFELKILARLVLSEGIGLLNIVEAGGPNIGATLLCDVGTNCWGALSDIEVGLLKIVFVVNGCLKMLAGLADTCVEGGWPNTGAEGCWRDGPNTLIN